MLSQTAHIIIGGSSITGQGLKMQLAHTQPDGIIVTTARSVTNIMLPQEQQSTDIGLDLSQKNIEENTKMWILGQVESLYADTITLHLHAMKMGGVDTKYPQKVADAFRQYTHATLQTIFISYEKDSHVDYGARDDKDELEKSVKNIDGTIVDLIVFDSPSAKALGPTFVGVVGDFLQNTAQTPEAEKSRELLKKLLGESFDTVQEFLQYFPLRGELKEGQQSMKELATTGKFQTVVNQWAKKIGFGDLSLVSGIISELYIELAMGYIAQNETIIQQEGKTNGRVLLDWEKILAGGNTQEAFKKLEQKLEELLQRKKDLEESNDLYTHQNGTYKLNPNKIDIFNQHFGILPMMMQHAFVQNSGILEEGEYIAEIKCAISIYAGDALKIEREGNTITIVNAYNPREVFSELKVKNFNEQEEKESNNGIQIEDSQIHTPQTLEQLSALVPHRQVWIDQFLNGVPSQMNGVKIPSTSAILENVGFRIGALIKLFPQILMDASGNKIQAGDLEALRGIFGTIKTEYQKENLAGYIQNGDFEYFLDGVKIRKIGGGLLFECKIHIKQGDITLASYKIIGG